MGEENQKFKYSEEYIQERLDWFFEPNSQKYNVDNLYIFDWESDKFIETRSGLTYEFEIKISRSDYKNDFKNKKDKHVILEGKEEFLPKYEKILDIHKEKWKEYYRTDSRKKPNYFYYAVPEGMIDVSEVPEYAGLVYILKPSDDKYHWVDNEGKIYWGKGFYVVKKAPKLHDAKYTDIDLKLGEKFYYNMKTWQDRFYEEKEKRLLTEDGNHKIPYAELMEKWEKTERENDALKALADTGGKKAELFSETMEMDRRIIRAYQTKMKEMNPDFDFIEFEDKIMSAENVGG